MLVFSESDQLANAMSHLLLLSPSLPRERERERERGDALAQAMCPPDVISLWCVRERERGRDALALGMGDKLGLAPC
mgnify:CR=1 FL=1